MLSVIVASAAFAGHAVAFEGAVPTGARTAENNVDATLAAKIIIYNLHLIVTEAPNL